MIRSHGLILLSAGLGTAVLSCTGSEPGSVETEAVTSAVTVSDALGFENVSDWTVVQGTATLSSSTVHTQGARSLAVSTPSSFVVFQSRALANTQIGAIASTVGLDVQLPTFEPNAFWKGAVQLYVEIPSENLFNAFVAQVELTPLTVGVFHHVTFAISPFLLGKLQRTYSDLKFKIALNTPNGEKGPYLFDALGFDGALAPSIDPPPLTGGPVTINPGLLPPGAHAKFPAHDGDSFFVTLPSVPVSTAPTVADVQTRLLAPILNAVGFTAGTAGLITPAAASPQTTAKFANSAGFLDVEYQKNPAYLRPDTLNMLNVFAGRTESSPDIDNALLTGEGMNFSQYVAGIERLAIDYHFNQLGPCSAESRFQSSIPMSS